MTATSSSFSAQQAQHILPTAGGPVRIYRLDALDKAGIAPALDRLPFSIRVLLESLLRNVDGLQVTEDDVTRLAAWNSAAPAAVELPFKPARVVLQDFTGVPLLVDIAAMRSAVRRLGGDPRRINPLVPVDLVVDHSVQVDYFGNASALAQNAALEFSRNKERYEFLRWGQNAVNNFNVVPPATGIVHQVNLEYLASGVLTRSDGIGRTAYPDTLVGTDSHTTMINGLGVLGWGVGGIEAEAVMLGQPLFMLTPQVIGVRLVGALREGVTATDLTLTITQVLRKKGVVDKFVEFYGPGLSALALWDRATIANMAPEYGATLSFFPFDDIALSYLRGTGRPAELVDLCERYYKEQGLFRTDASPDPIYTDVLEVDLSTIEPSLAGPKRPQDRVALADMKSSFQKALRAPIKDRGFALTDAVLSHSETIDSRGAPRSAIDARSPGGAEPHQSTPATLTHGSVVIAAITSCTNTSNPSVMLAAGLVAKRAVEAGLTVGPTVKTSLAPGSKVVTEYLRDSGLLPYLEQLGFNLVGYGCTTCIGNSGPLPEVVDEAVNRAGLVVAAVLSGNRNFEGRVHPTVKANYLASPPLVVAYALAGTVDKDLSQEPIGTGKDGKPVFLKDIWPSQEEVVQLLHATISPAMFEKTYAEVFKGNSDWNAIAGVSGDLYQFHEDSTYIHEPPFFATMELAPTAVSKIEGARALAVLGDSVTTDHISPAGNIAASSPAGKYLLGRGVAKADFNSYGARRGDDRVMVRGTFANIRLKNQMVPGIEGGVTIHVPSGEQMTIFEASERYQQEGTPLVVLAGKEYGTGSSRDWAAKGTLLLGVRAVIAESFERIHRSNLVGMGILPLVFLSGDSAESLGLTGREGYTIDLGTTLTPRQQVTVRATRPDGSQFAFPATSRLDTPIDVRYYQNGGILQTVLRDLIQR